MKDNQGLANHAISYLGKAYMYGYTGIVTEEIIQAKKKQYPRIYTDDYIARTRRNIGKWATDCAGLVDLYLGVDLSAAGYYKMSTIKGPIASMPKNVIGLLVFKVNHTSGEVVHVGIYMGNDTVIEAKGVDYGIVRTNLATGGWDFYAYCHLISYIASPTKVETRLFKGTKGEAVKSWQNSIIYLGYALPKFGPDGDFGTETYTATIEFQKRHGLEQNGIVDSTCWSKLISDLKSEENDLKTQASEVNALINSLSKYI